MHFHREKVMSEQPTQTDRKRAIRPIPLSARRGLLYPAFVWSGFTSAFVCVVIGNRLQSGLGTTDALAAVILGSWLLFVYSAAIGFAAGRWGLNSQLMLEAIFGRLGAILPGVLLALLVTGWFAFHVVLMTVVLSGVLQAAGGSGVWPLVVIGSLFAAPVIAGVSHGFNITAAAFPAMLVFAGVVVVQQIIPAWPTLLDGPLTGTLPFGTGVCVAFGTYTVSGTMTGDIVRYCRTGNEAVQATAIGFLFSNLPFMILGVLIGAANANVIDLLIGGSQVSFFLIVLVVISHWATCDACLTNAGITLKSAFPKLPWPVVSASAAVFGILIAASNVFSDVFSWILFIAAVVPPIGGIIVADYYVVRAHAGFSRARNIRVNVAALVSLCGAITVSLLIWQNYPDILTPLVGAPLSGILYLVLAALTPTWLGASEGTDSLGAEAID
jgi:cytosine permease